jgi:hypothetical protein
MTGGGINELFMLSNCCEEIRGVSRSSRSSQLSCEFNLFASPVVLKYLLCIPIAMIQIMPTMIQTMPNATTSNIAQPESSLMLSGIVCCPVVRQQVVVEVEA